MPMDGSAPQRVSPRRHIHRCQSPTVGQVGCAVTRNRESGDSLCPDRIFGLAADTNERHPRETITQVTDDLVDDRGITEVAARVLAKQADYRSFRRRVDATEFAVVGQTYLSVGAALCPATNSERNSVVTSLRFQ